MNTKFILKQLFFIFIALSTFIGLTAFTLFPFIQNYFQSERSLFIEPIGYGWNDYLGFVFPWMNRIFSKGMYDFFYPEIWPFLTNNLKFYSGILAIFFIIRAIKGKFLNDTGRFFVFVPLFWLLFWNKTFLKIIPIMTLFEKLSKWGSSQYHSHIIIIFCFAVVSSLVFDNLSKQSMIKKSLPEKIIEIGIILIYGGAVSIFIGATIVINSSLRNTF